MGIMAARFVTVDRDTPLILPPDMREWVPENHLSQFGTRKLLLVSLDESKPTWHVLFTYSPSDTPQGLGRGYFL